MRHSPNACRVCKSTATICIPYTGTPEQTLYHVWCVVCGAEGPPHEDEQQAKAAWDAENPDEVFTEWIIEPTPDAHDEIPRLTLRHVLAAEMHQYIRQQVISPSGKPIEALLPKDAAERAARLEAFYAARRKDCKPPEEKPAGKKHRKKKVSPIDNR